jgi:hypothetical protein
LKSNNNPIKKGYSDILPNCAFEIFPNLVSIIISL